MLYTATNVTLDQFAVAAVTSGHKLGGSNQWRFIFSQFWKSGCQQDGAPPAPTSSRGTGPRLFRPLGATGVPWLMAASVQSLWSNGLPPTSVWLTRPPVLLL